MRILDVLLGRSKLPQAKSEKLFAMSTAYVTLSSQLGYTPGGAGICFKPMEASAFERAEREVEELVRESCRQTGTRYKITRDSYNYTWASFHDPDFEDLVSTIYLVSETLREHGFGEQLLCSVFKFQGKQQTSYWIYNFKEGNYYPFIPLKDRKRDTSGELRLRAVMKRELPLEEDMGKCYPLWEIPV